MNVILLDVILSNQYKMNEIVNKFLLSGDTCMPKMHLKEPGLTYSACELFTKNKKRNKNIKETGYERYIDGNELDNIVFNMIWLIDILRI